MNPLEMLFAFREKAKAYGDVTRNKLLQQYGLDPLSMQRQQLEQQGQITAEQQARQQETQYAQNAKALKPLLSRFGAETAGQIGPLLASSDPQLQAQGNQILSGLLGQMQGQAPGGQLGVPSFSDFSTESMAEYQKTGDPRVLRYRTDPMAQARLDLGVARENRLREAQGRPPVGQLEAMIQDESIRAGYDAAEQNMRPEFFGYVSDKLGDAALEYSARLGGADGTPFVQFWNELDSQQAERRHALFGATLTEGEQAAWNKIAIKRSDSMATAKAKLEAQMRMIERRQQIRGTVLSGYGYQSPSGGQAVPPPPPGFTVNQ